MRPTNKTKHQPHILVLDDEIATIRSVKHLLRRKYIVHGASRGVDALEILARKPIEVVLSDQRMPGMTGDVFLAKVAETYPDTVRILITAYADMSALVRSVNRGRIFGYLEKPWKPKELEELVAKAIKYGAECIRCSGKLAALQQYNDDLTQSNADLRRLSILISHDVQEPLRTITAFSDVLSTDYRGILDGQAQHYLDRISACSKHLQVLVNELSQFKKMSEESDLPVSTVPLNGVVDMAVSVLEGQLHRTGAKVMKSSLPAVRGDAHSLVLVFQNLISNGIKFNTQTPLITVKETDAPKGLVGIQVCDNGIGIPKNFQPLVFESFKRLHTRSEYEGTGLGLAIVKSVIDRHGGAIELASEEGEGSVFTVYLPAA